MLLAGCTGAGDGGGAPPSEPVRTSARALNVTSDLFTHAPSAVPCSASGFTTVTNCYNTDLPPPPSLTRSLVAPRPRAGNAGTADQQYTRELLPPGGTSQPELLTSDARAVTFGGEVFEWPVQTPPSPTGPSGGRNEPGAMQVLPWSRTSIDGRLVLGPVSEWSNLGFFVFSPENLGYDARTSLDDHKRPFSRRAGLPHAVLGDPRRPAVCGQSTTTSCVYPASPNGSWQAPAQVYWDLCNTARPAAAPRTGPDLDTGNARPCTSSDGTSFIDGECYDVSLVAAVGYTWNDVAELTSTDLTVFVPRAKLAPTHVSGGLWSQSWADWSVGVRIYPRTSASALPNFHDYESPWDVNTFVTQARADCVGTNVPANRRWCEFFQKQRHVRPQDMTVDGWTAGNLSVNWAAGVYGEQLIEPTTTADGRVLMMNGGAYGLVYAVNTSPDPASACHVDEWTHLRPLSRAPWDARVNQTYGFARAGPYRDTQGNGIELGFPIAGAYPWVDRKGDHVFFSTGASRDAYRDLLGDSAFSNKNGTANVVVGAWTRGKLVVPDGGLNFTDWGYDKRLADNYGYSYRRDFQLYQGAATPVRPAGTIMMSSFENQLNHLDALAPVMPFDSVWTLSSNTQHNTELVFDEYLHPNALIIAHMNAPMTTASYVHSSNAGKGLPQAGQPPVYDDGFTSPNPEADVMQPGAQQYRFARTPKLQNASTITAWSGGGLNTYPALLELWGGARVEPVAQGGVLGKGVYLDGVNDALHAAFYGAGVTDWYLGVWLDGRDLGTLRTVFQFEPGDVTGADGRQLAYASWVALSSGQVVVRGGRQQQAVDLASLGLSNQRYFHFALKTWASGSERLVQVLINGNPVGAPLVFYSGMRRVVLRDPYTGRLTYDFVPYGPGMDMNNWMDVGVTPIWGTVDAPPPPPFQGWVDELRVYALGSAELAAGSYFEEQACNFALGSLAEVWPSDAGAAYPSPEFWLAYNASRYGIGAGGTFCEQLVLQSHEYPNDLGLQAGQTLCASRVHRNQDPGRCLREKKHGTDALPVIASQPLPDFASVAFCQSCHFNASDSIPGMRPDALLPGSRSTGRAYLDGRRRPMQWPRVLTGHVPSVPTGAGSPDEAWNWSPLAPFNQWTPVSPPGGGVYLDFLFNGQPRMTPR